MKFHVYLKGASGDPVDMGACSLANAIALAEDSQQRGRFLYITDANGRRLTIKAALRLKAGTDA